MTSLTGLTVMIPDHWCSRTDTPPNSGGLPGDIPAYQRTGGERVAARMRRDI